MPTKNGTFTEQDTLVINKWLQSKMDALPRCPICGADDWELVDRMTQLGRVEPATNIGLPIVGLVCNNCAHMLLFNAAKMGMEDPRESND